MRLIRPSSQLSSLYHKINSRQGYCLNKRKSLQIRGFATSEVGISNRNYSNYCNCKRFYLVAECSSY